VSQRWAYLITIILSDQIDWRVYINHIHIYLHKPRRHTHTVHILHNNSWEIYFPSLKLPSFQVLWYIFTSWWWWFTTGVAVATTKVFYCFSYLSSYSSKHLLSIQVWFGCSYQSFIFLPSHCLKRPGCKYSNVLCLVHPMNPILYVCEKEWPNSKCLAWGHTQC